MEREIMFRGQRIDTGEWVYGSLFNSIWINSNTKRAVNYIFPNDMLEIDNWEGDSWEDFSYVADQYEVDPQTVGQYTGLTDKNEEKIYEGDLIKTTIERNTFLSEVRWGRMSHSWSLKKYYDTCQCKYKYYKLPSSHRIEVVGNVHDNPELLNKKH